MDIKETIPLPKPTPVKTSQYRRNKNLWCEYHKDCGHTTRDCRELKKHLNRAADEGKIYKYLRSHSGGQKYNNETHSNDTNDEVNVISGGFA